MEARSESSMFTFESEEHCSGVVGILFLSVLSFLYIWDRNLYREAIGRAKVSSLNRPFSSLEFRKVDATLPVPWWPD